MLTAGSASLWIAAGAGAILAIAGLIARLRCRSSVSDAPRSACCGVGLSAADQGGVRRRELATRPPAGESCAG